MSGHVIMVNKGVACTHCGDEWLFLANGPLPVEYFVIASEEFEQLHAHCKPRDIVDVTKAKPTGLREWENSWHVGVSSATIFRVLAGRWPAGFSSTFGMDAPHDCDDMGRCVRLLDIMPEWRARLDEVGRACPAFAPLVPEWHQLETLYREKKGPELYTAISKLRGR